MDNTNTELPKIDLPETNIPPQQPVSPTAQPPQTPVPDNPLPGQVIGTNGSISTPPSQPINQPLNPQPIADNFFPEQTATKSNSKKWISLLGLGVLILVLITGVIIFFMQSKKKDYSAASHNASAPLSSTDNSDNETSSWKTYGDKLITIKYPDGWKIEPDDPMYGSGNFLITPPGSQVKGTLSEDDHTDNAKSNSSKVYWQTAYEPFGKVLAESSDSINGYDTYTVKQEPATQASFDLYTVVGKNKVKAVFNYGSWDKNKDTYEKIIKTIHIN